MLSLRIAAVLATYVLALVTSNSCEKYIVDPNASEENGIVAIREKASIAVPKLVDQILKNE